MGGGTPAARKAIVDAQVDEMMTDDMIRAKKVRLHAYTCIQAGFSWMACMHADRAIMLLPLCERALPEPDPAVCYAMVFWGERMQDVLYGAHQSPADPQSVKLSVAWVWRGSPLLVP